MHLERTVLGISISCPLRIFLNPHIKEKLYTVINLHSSPRLIQEYIINWKLQMLAYCTLPYKSIHVVFEQLISCNKRRTSSAKPQPGLWFLIMGQGE